MQSFLPISPTDIYIIEEDPDLELRIHSQQVHGYQLQSLVYLCSDLQLSLFGTKGIFGFLFGTEATIYGTGSSIGRRRRHEYTCDGPSEQDTLREQPSKGRRKIRDDPLITQSFVCSVGLFAFVQLGRHPLSTQPPK